MIRAFGSALALLVLCATASAGELRLLMIDEDDCPYCQRWEHEVGGVYALTPEGRAAPLSRRGLYDEGLPADLDLQEPVRYTPTFLLLAGSAEVGRITGYPGEAHFWGLLEQMLRARGAL